MEKLLSHGSALVYVLVDLIDVRSLNMYHE